METLMETFLMETFLLKIKRSYEKYIFTIQGIGYDWEYSGIQLKAQ
jgi:hypothetical protein